MKGGKNVLEIISEVLIEYMQVLTQKVLKMHTQPLNCSPKNTVSLL